MMTLVSNPISNASAVHRPGDTMSAILDRGKKFRVLHLIGSFETGGSETQAVQLVRLLHADSRCEVFAACLDRRGPLGAKLAAVGINDIPEYKLTSFHNWNAITQLRRLVWYLRARRISVVHTHDFYTNIFGITAACLAGVPVRIAARRESSSFRSSVKRAAERIAYRYATVVLANCADVKRQLVTEGVDERKIRVIYNGLDTQRFYLPESASRVQIANSFGLDPSKRFISLVANLRHAVKDHPTFLRAAARVSQQEPDTRFVLAGEGPLAGEIREFTTHLGVADRVIFLGRCDRVPDVLAITDVAVLSSVSEGFPNSVLEYMAAGCPVVSTDVGGVREMLTPGEGGYLVKPGDDAAMADSILNILRNPSLACSMREHGRRAAEQRFSCKALLENVLSLYDTLLQRPAASTEQLAMRAPRP